MARKKPKDSSIAVNRRARHDYYVVETLEAGLVLTGTETKSVRLGRVSLQESYGRVEKSEAWIHNMHISPYTSATRENVEPTRTRKLLLHRREIERLAAQTDQKGMTLIPLRLYFSPGGLVKMELGVCRGKKLHDKREVLAERDARRQMERSLRGHE